MNQNPWLQETNGMPSKYSHRYSLMVSVCNYFLMAAMLVSICFSPNMVSRAYAEKRFYSLHLSSFKNISRAVKEVNKLKRLGHDAFYRHEMIKGKEKWYRIYIGKFNDKEEARKVGSELKEKGLISYFMPVSIDGDIKDSTKSFLPEKPEGKHAEATEKKKTILAISKREKPEEMKHVQSTVVTQGKGGGGVPTEFRPDAFRADDGLPKSTGKFKGCRHPHASD